MRLISILNLISVACGFSVGSSSQNRKTWGNAWQLAANAKPGEFEYALIFDCDGVIIETEELHRLAYNAAFESADLKIDGQPVIWSTEYYDILQNTVGKCNP
jgi:hypothetical protein